MAVTALTHATQNYDVTTQGGIIDEKQPKWLPGGVAI